MTEIYDEDYFERGIQTGKSGYENYRWMPERIYKEVRVVINLLGINPKDKVLDFGAAKGFWVRGFRDYGIDAFGVDISEYALSHSDDYVKDYLSKYPEIPDMKFDFIVSRNTLEHIEESELEKILTRFYELTNVVFFTVPLVDPITRKYIMQMLDTTHKIFWTNEEWILFCEKCGWKVENLFKLKGVHDKWESYPNSMGFYILRKK
jgi:SAM-dependent methyltransferase